MKKANKKTTSKRRIAVFDSGVGGLSVLKELHKLLPNEDFSYLADQKYLPYGDKSQKMLTARISKIVNYFKKYHHIKMLVVACNTATSCTITELRKKYDFPIVGTIPAIKVAGELTKTGTVAVLSTVSTSKSQALKDLIDKYCRDINVLNIGLKDLVELVEQGHILDEKVTNLLKKYLVSVKNSRSDYVVLGCTHYPFLKKTISKILGPRVKLIDSGKAIAKHTKTLLVSHFLQNIKKEKGSTLYFTTGDPVKFSKVASLLLKTKIKAKKVLI